MFEFTGIVRNVGETMSFGSNGFTKREIIVEEDGEKKFPNLVPFCLKKDNCSHADGIKAGDRVRVGFVIEGRAWDNPKTGKTQYFCDNTILKLAVEGGEAESNVPPPAVPTKEEIAEVDTDEDMPF